MVDFSGVFDYDGEALVYKVKVGTRGVVGQRAGFIENSGYIRVTHNKKRYQAHRVIWEMMYGKIQDGMYVDHINHNRSDNRLCNLRLVTKGGNSKNASGYKTNTSGVTGVSWHKRDKVWQAYLTSLGKRVYLGCFKYLEFAELVVQEAREKFGFHKNHGK